MLTYDVTLPIREGMPVWPGDPPVRIERLSSAQAGDAFGVSRLTLGSHTGTHVDAPSHALPEGPSLDLLPLEAFWGAALLCSVPGVTLVTAAELAMVGLPAGCRRLLLRTANSERNGADPLTDYVALDESAARWLVERGVALVGIDAPSIEPPGAEMGPVHRILLRGGVVILEGLALGGVPPGEFELVCLPLAIVGADGAPARVLLRTP